MEILEDAMRWHMEGHKVVLYTPFESSTAYGRMLTEYGKEGLYFERRPYPGCRGIELAILTGSRLASAGAEGEKQ